MTNDKQKDRLVELVEEADQKVQEYIIENDHMDWIPKSKELSEVRADYLLASGVIVPPCKVGDKIYWINHITKEIETDIVIAIHQYEDGLSIATNTIGRKSTTTFSLNRFLEIMSFTKEEAEAKLKEGVQG